MLFAIAALLILLLLFSYLIVPLPTGNKTRAVWVDEELSDIAIDWG